MVNEFWKRWFNATVCMEFQVRVCFTFAKYENDMLLLFETTNVFINAFCNSKIHFHQSGPFKLLKKQCWNLKCFFQCGIIIQRVVTIHGVPSVQLSRMMYLQIEFAKNKCLGTIWSTEMMPTAWTHPAREHYKTLISCDLTIWPPLCSWPIFFNTISTPDCKRRVTQQYMTYFCTDIN